MIDPSFTNIIATIPSFIAALSAALIGWANHTKMEEVHILVNSSFTKLKNDLSVANILITDLQNQIVKLTSRPSSS